MKRGPDTRIRILVLGPPGVGKDSLESRFTTMKWPPPYNPALILTSRRHFTLLGERDTSGITVTAPPRVHTSPYLAFSDSDSDTAYLSHRRSSSVYSKDDLNNDASIFQRREDPGSPPRTPIRPRTLSDECHECVKTANTFMVEILNYPLLQCARERARVLASGEYDAVLLLYDVGSRASFEAMPALHDEIPLRGGRRSSWRPQSSHRSDAMVIALVGNKADLDGDAGRAVPAIRRPMPPRGRGPAAADRKDAEGERKQVYREFNIFDGTVTSYRLTTPSATHDRPNSAVPSDVPTRRRTLRKLVKRQSVRSVRAKDKKPPPLTRSMSQRELVDTWLKARPPARSEPTVVELDSIPQIGKGILGPKRQVSRADGEDLARLLDIPVPFAETSARTGENVEELFDAVVREVLRQKGVDLPQMKAGGGKTCRLHVARDSKFNSPVSSPVDLISETGRDEWPPVPPRHETDARQGALPESQPARRQSVLRRMGTILRRKKRPAVADVWA